jgi:hypothetical protein
MNADLHSAGVAMAALALFALALLGARALARAIFRSHDEPTESMAHGADDPRAPETGDQRGASSTAPGRRPLRP